MEKLIFKFLLHTNRYAPLALFGFPLFFLVYLTTVKTEPPGSETQRSTVTLPLWEPGNNSPWENIQTTFIEQENKNLPPIKLNLDQVRNGSAASPTTPGFWQNGNAGASNAHYVEGYSIPYRVKITNLTTNAPRSIDIEWDIRHSSANAIDFITNFDLIDYPSGSHVFNFGHVQEVINPIIEAGTWSQGTSLLIPAPSLPAAPLATFNQIQSEIPSGGLVGDLGKFGIWNASITGLTYISEGDLGMAQSSTRLRIFFTNTASTVMISWGGHIAREADWGMGNSAVAVSGSPYHTRLLEFDEDGAGPGGPSSTGNQDRSLSADAVQDPPACSLGGPALVQCNTNNVYTSGLTAADLTGGVEFAWSLINNTSGATFVGATNDIESVTVNSGSTCNANYTVKLQLTKNGQPIGDACTKVVSVQDTQAPGFTSCPSGSDLGCNPSTFPTPGGASATDNCGTPSITSSLNSEEGSGCVRTTRRIYTATDACGNTATCQQVFTYTRDMTGPTFTSCPAGSDLGCNPSGVPAPGTATATDACGTPSITSSTGSEQGTGCVRSVTRIYTATDACGNTSTCSQVFTYTVDITGPTFTFCPPGSDLGCNPGGVPAPGAATATDACGTPSINSSTGSEQGTGCVRSVTRVYTATDACGNTSTCSQVFTYTVDNTGPTFTFCPTGSDLGCNPGGIPGPGVATATDACGTPSITSSLGSEQGADCNKTRTRTYVATDACGNTSTCSQVFTYVVDVTPPLLTCPPDATVECDASTTPGDLGVGEATATDACSTASVSSSDNTTNNGCITVITRTWTAVDGCGNTATCEQHIIKKDQTPPTITCNPDGSATASDNCGSVVLFFANGEWKAVDESGNVSTMSCPVESTRIMAGNTLTDTKEVVPLSENTEEPTRPPVGTNSHAKELSVQAIPNPFNDRVKFVVNNPKAGNASLEVMNMLGQKIKSVYTGQLPAGVQTFEMTLPPGRYTTLLYILRVDGKQVTGKMIQASAKKP